jgi:hypothetical protein
MSVGTRVLLCIRIVDDITLVLPVCVIQTQILVFIPEQYSSVLHIYHNWVIIDTLSFVPSDDGSVKLKQLVESYESDLYTNVCEVVIINLPTNDVRFA